MVERDSWEIERGDAWWKGGQDEKDARKACPAVSHTAETSYKCVCIIL